jgi:hypothetical protein
MRPGPPKGSIPLGEDVMQLARMGEIGAMQNLFTAKKFTANHRDEEGITPLHVRYSKPLAQPNAGDHRAIFTDRILSFLVGGYQ